MYNQIKQILLNPHLFRPITDYEYRSESSKTCLNPS